MIVISQGWELDVERGPDWLFVRPRVAVSDESNCSVFAEQILEIMRQNFAHRLLLELDGVRQLPTNLLEQLVQLQRRIAEVGGTLKVTGLSPSCEAALRAGRVEKRFPCYPSREEAVMNRGHMSPR
jgi:anti-anti-sigma regulatory factor